MPDGDGEGLGAQAGAGKFLCEEFAGGAVQKGTLRCGPGCRGCGGSAWGLLYRGGAGVPCM
ncbi:hypothetical protein GCM10027038_01140 [Arthrobacter bambusae]